MSLIIHNDVLQYNVAHQCDLFVRFGINLWPVHVVKDINGMPNIIGDGINVAQRVMSFAKPNQILVSRTYYEVTSRLTDEINEMFSYFGMKQDKHVREHEIYEINAEAEKLKSLADRSSAGQSKTGHNAMHATNVGFNKAALWDKSFWLQHKYYMLGSAFLLTGAIWVSLPKTAPSKASNVDPISDSNGIQKPVSSANEQLAKSPKESLVKPNSPLPKRQPSTAKVISVPSKASKQESQKITKKIKHLEASVNLPRANPQPEPRANPKLKLDYDKCSQAEKSLNQCH